ncbi:hypothetical protein P7C73_g6714, partial [Tremellales sp. Uapishka_1]
LHIPLLKYWDGQPVTYVCQQRAAPGESPVGGKVYWAVAFEIVDEDARRELEKKGGKVIHEAKRDAAGDDEEEKISDEVD